MTDVKKGALPPGAPTAGAREATASQAGQKLLKAHNAAGKQARSSPKSEYQRPHRVHTGREARIAAERHHAAEMEEEARRLAQLALDPNAAAAALEEKEHEKRIEGLNFDEERKKKGRQQQKDDDRDDREDAEEAVALGQAAAAKGFASAEGAGKYFQDLPPDRLGDQQLTDPNEMKRLLGPSARFAQHAMLLAEERLKEGATRDEAVAFLASLYLGVADRAYANKALREFGCGTGIIDLYPLEVMAHLLEHVPSFFTSVSKGRFFAAPKTGSFKGRTGEPIVLKYPAELRIRGFALKGGAKPGYVFEPVDPPGTYHLTFRTPGHFTVMVSAIAKNGAVMIEELDVDVTLGKADFDEAAAIKREKKHEADQAAEEARAAADPTTKPADPTTKPADPTTKPADPTTKPAEPAKKDDLKINFPRRI
ncbi:hypothetical protein L6R52_36925 [Myxococcota bacterium]|nr:hypothetical protein [Myxococcota bacterium]